MKPIFNLSEDNHVESESIVIRVDPAIVMTYQHCPINFGTKLGMLWHKS